MHFVFLVAYILLPILTWWRTRSLAWTVISVLAAVSIAGVLVNFLIDFVSPLTWGILQWILLGALAVPMVVSILLPRRADGPRKRQVIGILIPVAALTALFIFMTTWWTSVPAFQTPVNFLMGHALAEDNAKWLDYGALLATGNPIQQAVPLGGPLQLFLVLVATLMAVVSQVVYGGVNEVLVAANTAIYGQFALVVLAPLALAPLAEVKVRANLNWGNAKSRAIPAPLIWTGSVILVAAVLMATAYGHLTWQFTAIIATLWTATFLVDLPIPRARLLTSLIVAAGMTVWFPMNVIAITLIAGWLAVLVARGVRRREWDALGLSLVILVAVGIWQPIWSSLTFVLDSTSIALHGIVGVGGGIPTAIPVPDLGTTFSFIDSTLFAASGGTEQVEPLLAIVAAVSVVGAALMGRGSGLASYARLMPVGLVLGFAVVLQVMDQWATGSAPNYGSIKFTFLAVVVVAAACVPLVLMLITPQSSGMSAPRWIAVLAVIVVLVADSLLVRAVAAARPQQWSPPIPFENPRSYWWPADVNATADQPIARNPVGCVYLPAGAKAPSAILDSQLSDAQRVYSCTRLLAGLAGKDTEAQPLVDWLRREWLTNERAWEGVNGYLAAMPDAVLDAPLILLDDGSNVIGLESMRSLLDRYPGDAWTRP